MTHITAYSFPLYLQALPSKPLKEVPVRAFFAHKELANRIVEPAELRRRIQAYSINELLFYASKMSLVCEVDGGINNNEFQRRVSLLMPEQMQLSYETQQIVHEAFEERVNRKYMWRPVFTQIHGAHFMKQVILHHTGAGEQVIHTEQNPGSVEEVFLTLIQFMDHFEIAAEEESDELKGMSSLIRSSIFFNRSSVGELIRRYYNILFNLSRIRNGFDLPAVFQRVTNISLEMYFSVGFGILLNFVKASNLQHDSTALVSINENVILNWQNYFRFSQTDPEEREKVKSRISAEIGVIRTEFITQEAEANAAGNPQSFEYNLKPFMQLPLVELTIGPHICSHLLFFVEKFTSGIFWVIFDELSGSEKGAFINYWGDLCQQHAEEIFKLDFKPFAKRGLKFFFDIPYNQGSRATDIIIYDSETKELFLFEITYSSYRLEVATSLDNLPAFAEAVDKIVDKAGQINSVIRDFKSHLITDININPDKVKAFHPFVVTMGHFPNWRFVWKSIPGWTGIENKLKSKNYLQASDIHPLRIISMSELELCAALHREGSNIFTILSHWSKEDFDYEEPLKNYLIKTQKRRADFSRLDVFIGQAGVLTKRVLNSRV